MEAGSGLLGFAVVVALLAASYLLFRSMSTRLRNVARNAPEWPERGGGDVPQDLADDAGSDE